MTLVALLGFTSSRLRVKFFQFFSTFLHSLRLNSLPVSRSYALILAANTCLMSFRFFFKVKGSSLSVLVLRHHNKTVLMRGHLLDVVRTLLLESSVSPRFWCEALSTAAHLINCLPSLTTNHVSPFSKLFGHSPLYSDLRTFGCICFAHLPPHERHKLTAQSVKCVFLGYGIPHKGYVCYDPHASRIWVSRNVIFFENQYFFSSHVQLSSASISFLPIFSESPTVVEWFKPGFVYERRSRHEFGSTSFVPPFDLDLAPDPAPASTTLRQFTRASRPPN